MVTVLVFKVLNKIKIKSSDIFLILLDFIQGSYYKKYDGKVPNRFLNNFSGQKLLKWNEIIVNISDNIIEHKFDILGSGPIRNSYDMDFSGLYNPVFNEFLFINKKNTAKFRINKLKNSRYIHILTKYLTPNYQRIDWQVDIKSGYRWNETTWYRHIKYQKKYLADIKVPWELARLQHLPFLAYRHINEKTLGRDNAAELFASEFRNQVIDFISSNPPRYGVNWACTMDVAIRSVNIILSYEIFTAIGYKFDKKFIDIILNSIYDHGKHCIKNLENKENKNNNHYLSNLTGILFISIWLPEDEEVLSWFEYSVGEILVELDRQFDDEGANIEGSSSYHCLSAQMIIYSLGLLINLGNDSARCNKNKINIINKFINISEIINKNFANHYLGSKVLKILKFMKDITRENGEILMIGDNDSGRLVKIWPKYELLNRAKLSEMLNLNTNIIDCKNYYNENDLNYMNLIQLGESVIFKKRLNELNPEYIVFNALLFKSNTSND